MDFINPILDNIQGRFADAIDFITNPLWFWYFAYALLVIVGGLIIWFAGWIKGVRQVIGSIVILAGAFLAGGHVMYRETKDRHQADKDRIKELEREKKAQTGSGSHWPFG